MTRHLHTILCSMTLLFGLAAFADAAPAPDGVCDKPVLRAEGRRSDPGSPAFKERMARRYSIRKWEQLANELYGHDFARWRTAGERRIECDRYDEPGFSGRVSCVASGQPCTKR